MSKIFGYLVTGGMISGVVIALAFAINSSIQLPDVYFSYATDECVKVVNYAEGHNYTCDNLPTKFYHAWVQ